MIAAQSAATAAVMALDSHQPVQEISYDALRMELLKAGQVLAIPQR